MSAEASFSNRAIPSPLQFDDFQAYFSSLNLAMGGKKGDLPDEKWAALLKYSSRRTVGMIRLGRRKPSPVFLDRLSQFLGLSSEENVFLQQMNRTARGIGVKRPRARKVIAESQANQLAHWYTMAIKQLADTPGFRPDPVWIKRRLRHKLEPNVIRRSLEQLERAGLLKSSTPLTTSTDIPVAAIRMHHSEQMVQAIGALREVPVEEREFCSLSLVFDRSRMQEAKGVIRRFLEEFDERFCSKSADDVFQLGIQFFPHTRRGKA